jgi:alkanesulfonate monooxygenase SsuD/methylene tetrahydromethanopterin reductase-like flavin-dependent oxidoreductase (luciferase family)
VSRFDHIGYALTHPRRVSSYISSVFFPSDEGVGIVGTPGKAIKKIEAYLNVGVQHFILRFPVKETLDTLKVFSNEVLPSFETN